MHEVPKELKYVDSHEWVRDEGNNTYVIGISDFAQTQLGDLVFVELPELNESIDAGDDAAVVESVKSAEDVINPIAGQVIAVNQDLEDAPGVVNQYPYGDGWLYKIKAKDDSDYKSLLSHDDYLALITEE